jgi:hypothetical protein
MIVNECGCTGTEHKRRTCLRWYEFHPDQEVGLEFAEHFDG